MKNLTKFLTLSVCALLFLSSLPLSACKVSAASKDIQDKLKNNKDIAYIAKNVNLFVETSSALQNPVNSDTIKVNLTKAGKVDVVCAAICGSGDKRGIDFKDMKYVLEPEVLDAAGEVVTPEVAIKYGEFINTILEFFIIHLVHKRVDLFRGKDVFDLFPDDFERFSLPDEKILRHGHDLT